MVPFGSWIDVIYVVVTASVLCGLGVGVYLLARSQADPASRPAVGRSVDPRQPLDPPSGELHRAPEPARRSRSAAQV